MKEKLKQILKRLLIVLGKILLGFVVLILVLCVLYKRKYPGPRTEFASIQEFDEYGGDVLVELPEGASDIKYYHDKTAFVYSSIYSFVIRDDAEYDSFMEKMKDVICFRAEGEIGDPSWEDYIEPYTDEELYEMEYLKEHCYEMDYKEILSRVRFRYGFVAGYGAYVRDYTNMDYDLAEFPMRDCFNYVTEGDLKDYRILKFYPSRGGTSEFGIILDEKSRRFVAFKFATLR